MKICYIFFQFIIVFRCANVRAVTSLVHEFTLFIHTEYCVCNDTERIYVESRPM